MFLLSCSDLETPRPRLDRAEPTQIPSAPQFQVTLFGQGFGLGRVRFDLDEGRGRIDASDLSVILDGPGLVEQPVPSESVAVLNPRQLQLAVRLERPLPLGPYGVRLQEGDQTVAQAGALFEVVLALGSGSGGDAAVEDVELGPSDAGHQVLDGSAEVGVELESDGGLADGGGAPFLGSYRFRQAIEVPISGSAPAGITLRVPIPHASLVSNQRSRPDARDIVVYQGQVPLPFQWEDRRRIGTNDLIMVVQLAEPLSDNPPAGALQLYYGDPSAANDPSDRVFVFSQRFQADISPVELGNARAWSRAEAWQHCLLDRSQDAPLANGSAPASYCAVDRISGRLVRQTLSTPVLPAMVPLPSEQVFEMRLWLAGRTIDGRGDILYFAHGASNDRFDETLQLPASAWSGLSPTERLEFEEIDNTDRQVNGWRFGSDQIEWWRAAIARFNIQRAGGRSLHLRYVSTLGPTSQDSFAAVDDWTVRVALDPEPALRLGSVERR